MTEQDEATYTIDQLAALTGVPSRTIRFYQSKGALPAPVRRGRKAYYDRTHVERLELIARLQDRGLQIRAIRNLVDQLACGQASLDDWLGFEAELRMPWSEDVPELLSDKEIQERLAGRPPGLLAALVNAGMLEREANQYLVRSPALMKMVLTLEANGIDVVAAHEATEILSRHLSKAATELGLHFQEHVQERVRDGGIDSSAQLLTALKPIALEAASVIFAREIQRALEQMLHEGRLAPVTSPRGDEDDDETLSE
ncbi:MAG: MerR family transcriptional regulator [Deltaproteobacteria bacterium]|nr:MerR family transcriptional regulator [Deltaproteobacteria bacterium]MBW2211869.1 MerR family transcriptional regulator [Deltaproteobacteria bacterium]MBW2214465.1 MerR family transcriptional regulator [Deltaproteobacteria bacterium]MBW2380449.1 MerR family transcriptional regulator [Deltaproteobacteria bacterium]MBW2629114.1 MerR family transcriptional regulator [Deltaproteobacteria bacterium]